MSTPLPSIPTSVGDGPLLDVESTFGSPFLGAVASMGFFGVFTLQCYIYFITYSEDRRIIKYVVGFVWILEFLRTVFGVHAVYYYLVLEWGNIPASETSIWSLNINIVFTSLVQCTVHACFIFRVWILSKRNKWLTTTIALLAFSNFVFSIATFVVSQIAEIFKSIQNKKLLVALFPTGLACAIASDFLIMLSFSWFIWPAGLLSESSLSGMFKKIVFILINLGLLTSLSDVAVLVLSVAPPSANFAFYSMYTVVGNFYANSLLATLNTRTSLQKSSANSVVLNTAVLSSYIPQSGLSAPSCPPVCSPTDVTLVQVNSLQASNEYIRGVNDKTCLGASLTDGDFHSNV